MPKTEEEKAKQREYNRAYYQRKKEELKAKAKERHDAKPVEERHAEEAAYRERAGQKLKDYNRAYYNANKERLKELNRASAKERREREAMAKLVPAPETLPPPPTEEEWSLSEFKAAAARPPPPVVVAPLPPPPPLPAPVTEAVRATGAGAELPAPPKKLTAKERRWKEDKEALEQQIMETVLGFRSRISDGTLSYWEHQKQKLGLGPKWRAKLDERIAEARRKLASGEAVPLDYMVSPQKYRS